MCTCVNLAHRYCITAIDKLEATVQTLLLARANRIPNCDSLGTTCNASFFVPNARSSSSKSREHKLFSVPSVLPFEARACCALFSISRLAHTVTGDRFSYARGYLGRALCASPKRQSITYTARPTSSGLASKCAAEAHSPGPRPEPFFFSALMRLII